MSASCQAPPPRVDLAGLELSEQLVLWIWRELHAERAQPSTTLVGGLLLAFGLCRVEAALDRVLALWRSYDGHRRRPPGVAARRAPLVLAEERLLIGLVATAQQGALAPHEAILLRLVHGAGTECVADAARELAILLARAGFRLPGRVRQIPDRPAPPAGDAAEAGLARH